MKSYLPNRKVVFPTIIFQGQAVKLQGVTPWVFFRFRLDGSGLESWPRSRVGWNISGGCRYLRGAFELLPWAKNSLCLGSPGPGSSGQRVGGPEERVKLGSIGSMVRTIDHHQLRPYYGILRVHGCIYMGFY